MAKDRETAEPATGLQGLGIGALNVGNLLDTVEFVRNAWAAFGVPSSLAPTADVDELDRRIADLKAVEQWLTMNLNLLRTSVQALEIQRGTIATLKAYGAMIGAPSSLPGAHALAQAMASVASGAMAAASGAAPASTSAAPVPGAASGAAPTPGAAPIPAATPEAAAQAAQAPAAEGTATAGGERPAPAASALPGLDAGAWWDLLQRQFNQIAAATLGAHGEGTAPADEAKTAGGQGAPVARSGKTPSGAKTKTSSTGGPEPGRRGRRPAR